MNKTFDCVEMKREAQKKALEKLGDLQGEERNKRRREIIQSDPILRRFLERVEKNAGAR